MKNVLLLVVFAGLMTACGTSKIERQAQRTFKGDWTLNSVTFPENSGFVDVTLFEDVDRKCFEGSEWHFVSNNNKGEYQIFKEDCSPGKREFRWNVEETNPDSGEFDFTLKPVSEGQNARKTAQGYRLNLVSLDDTQMVWEQTVSFEGEPFKIRMEFTKN